MLYFSAAACRQTLMSASHTRKPQPLRPGALHALHQQQRHAGRPLVSACHTRKPDGLSLQASTSSDTRSKHTG